MQIHAVLSLKQRSITAKSVKVEIKEKQKVYFYHKFEPKGWAGQRKPPQLFMQQVPHMHSKVWLIWIVLNTGTVEMFIVD